MWPFAEETSRIDVKNEEVSEQIKICFLLRHRRASVQVALLLMNLQQGHMQTNICTEGQEDKLPHILPPAS